MNTDQANWFMATAIYTTAPTDPAIRAIEDVMNVRHLQDKDEDMLLRMQETADDECGDLGQVEIAFYTDADTWPQVLHVPDGHPPVSPRQYPLLISVSPGLDESDRRAAWAIFGSLADHNFSAVLTYDDKQARATAYGTL